MRLALYLVVLCLLSIGSLNAAPADNAPNDPFAPTLNREDVKLLAEVMALEQSDRSAAVALLEEQDLEEASAALDFALGNLYYQNDQLPQAASAYEKAIAKHPKFRQALSNLGRVYLLLDRPSDTIKLYQQLSQDGQADAPIYLLLGHALLMEDYPVSAQIAYQQALLLRPQHPETMTGLAKCLMLQERYTQGLAMVREILQQDPNNAELWSLQAHAQLALDHPEQTIRTIETARRLQCVDAELLATLGDLYLNEGQASDALVAYNQAFAQTSPSIARMLRALQGFLMVNDAKGTEHMLSQIEQHLDSPQTSLSPQQELEFLRLKGQWAHLQGHEDQALAAYQEILTLDPLNGETLLLLAEAQWQQGDLEDAALNCERATRIHGHETDALTLYAQIEVERQHYAQAVKLLQSAQTFHPQNHIQRYLEQLQRMIP